jgi:hypothetical protein
MTQEQSELLKEQIRARYEPQIVTDILINLGYEFDRNKKFKLRAEEKTASTSVGKNGLINDFGGYGGDILKILTDYHAMSFIDAMKYTADQMGITYPDDGYQESEYEKQQKRQQIETLKLERIRKREEQDKEDYKILLQKQEEARKTIAWYDSYSYELQTFHNLDYQNEALAIAPIWVFQQATPDAIKHFKYLTSYDHKNRTIIAKIFDYNGQLISYKRRRYLIPGYEEPSKWVTKGGTSPNKQCYISIPNAGPVYIIEGHHDMLTAALIQNDDYDPFNFIMIPTENYHKFNDYELQCLKGRDINFIMDVKKEDVKKSALSMINLSGSLPKEQSDDAVLINLFDFLTENKINHEGISKMDLSDAIAKWNNTLTAFKGSLEYYADTIRCGNEIF